MFPDLGADLGVLGVLPVDGILVTGLLRTSGELATDLDTKLRVLGVLMTWPLGTLVLAGDLGDWVDFSILCKYNCFCIRFIFNIAFLSSSDKVIFAFSFLGVRFK